MTYISTNNVSNDDLETLGGRVKVARQLFGLKQIELSKLAKEKNVELSKWALSRLESNVREVTQKELEFLADTFGVHATWLLMGNLTPDSLQTYPEIVTGMESAILVSYRQGNFTNLMFLLGLKAADSLGEIG